LNAARAEADTEHLRQLAYQWGAAGDSRLAIRERPDLGILACQGPAAGEKLAAVLDLPELLECKAFRTLERDGLFLSRTGYTGEVGFEIIAPGARLRDLADALLAAGVQPAGLAARDSLRLEAGLNLYGQDMTVADSPARSNLDWTVDLRDETRVFVGRAALAAERAAGPTQCLRGLLLEDGIARTGGVVSSPQGVRQWPLCADAAARHCAGASDGCDAHRRQGIRFHSRTSPCRGGRPTSFLAARPPLSRHRGAAIVSTIPEHLRYSTTHEWVEDLGSGRYRVGITDHAQELLGDLVYVELPELGRGVQSGVTCGVLESVKAASDLIAPLTGVVAERNEALGEHPEWLNEDPYGRAWLLVLEAAPAATAELLDAAAYGRLIEGQ
ncbi:MAG: glycine cleavage system protein GcvH, partial [Acidithiobacillus sp.]